MHTRTKDDQSAWIRLWSADLHIASRTFRAPWFTAHPDGTYTGERILCEKRLDGKYWWPVVGPIRDEVFAEAGVEPEEAA